MSTAQHSHVRNARRLAKWTLFASLILVLARPFPAHAEPETNGYVVQRGDTPLAIASRLNISLDALMAANPGLRPTALQIGQRIQLPSTEATSPSETPSAPSTAPVSAPAESPTAATDAVRAQVVDLALSLRGIPYVYGGASPRGFDCSGFVSYVFRHAGVDLPHNAAAMFNATERVARADLQPGDLVFFAASRVSGITHVGIYIGDDLLVDAPYPGRSVGTESMSNPWYHATRFVSGGRVLPTAP